MRIPILKISFGEERRYRREIRNNPQEPEPYIRFGKFLVGKNRLEEACKMYEGAMKLKPEDLEMTSSDALKGCSLRSQLFASQKARFPINLP